MTWPPLSVVRDEPDYDPGVRYFACPHCGGDRGWEWFTGGYDPRDGSPHIHWVKCDACDDDGGVWEPVFLLDMEDLDDVHSD